MASIGEILEARLAGIKEITSEIIRSKPV